MFQFDSKWDVDTAAESLNTSLFGKPKKHKPNKLQVTSSSASLDKSYVSTILDSDDEQYTKKDKKKLKKRKKKNKVHDRTVEIGSTELNQSFDQDSKIVGAKKNVKNSGKTTEILEQKKINLSSAKIKSNIANAKPKKVKKENKDTEAKINIPSDEQLQEKKSKKRKRSLSQSADPGVGSKKKIAKVEELKNSTEANGDVAESGEGKKKRKRKKKNNSKKNKYKHLALNSKSKSENSDIPQVSGSLRPNLEAKNVKSHEHSQKFISNKSCEFIQKNTGISTNATLSDSSALVQKQDTDNHTGSLTTDSQVKSKSKKRKNYQDNHTASTKKLKQSKNNPKDKATTSSTVQPATTRVAKSEEQDSAKPSMSLKNKKKQQVLLKLLTEAQIKKQDSLNVSSKKDSTSDKKKRKVLLENGSTDNSKSRTERGNKKEIVSEDAQKKPAVNPSPVSHSIWGKAAELGQQAKEKLDSARFRYINEQLYSCTGNDAMKLFREDRVAFSVYHEGFQNQVNKWPVNPIDIFIKQIKDKPKNLVIADFGCGDAKLAQGVPQKVHSFDLVALNNKITVCDMSKTPLPGEHVDIAVFCLSLMGTNITDYILEANRVLKTGGLLKIAEVVSRFSGLSRFVEGVCNCGFQLLNKRDKNQMFFLLDFKKIKPVKKSASVGEIKLKPCIYKRR